ncbi:MAG: choice-of-anchor W domain-containing protein [Planctomycetota bacterium]
MNRGVLFVALCAGAVATGAQAQITSELFAGGDAGFNALTDNGALEQAVVESRVGDGGTNQTWELGLWRFGAVGTPLDEANRTISSGSSGLWEISYDGASTLSFTIDGVTVSSDSIGGSFSDIFIRVRAADASVSSIGRVRFDGDLLDPFEVRAEGTGGDSDVQYLRIGNSGDAFGAFTLQGTQALIWTGDMPRNSALAAQFKFTNVIPSPGAAFLLGAAGLAATRRRR